MDLNLLSKLLTDLLNTSQRVSLPGLGSFVSEEIPATITSYGTILNPPSARTLFKTSESWNDELLERAYAEHEKISHTIAKEEISEFIQQLKRRISQEREFSIPGVGVLRYISDEEILFEAMEGVIFWPESTGLEPLNIKPLAVKGEVENISGKPDFVKAPSKYARDPEKKGSAYKSDTSREVINRTSPRSSTPESIDGRSAGLSFLKFLLRLVVVALVLSLIAATIYIFREDLRPLLEKILYSGEERELLKYLK